MNKLSLSYIGTEGWNDEECVNNYALDPDYAIASMYAKYAGMLHTIGRAFYKLSEADVESFAFEIISKALDTFSSNKDAKFSTYLTRLFKNRLINESRALEAYSKSRGWYLEVSFASTLETEEGEVDVFSNIGYDEDFSAIEMDATIDTLTLSANEYAIIECILNNKRELKDAEIAADLGIPRGSVSYAKKQLKRKLKNLF